MSTIEFQTKKVATDRARVLKQYYDEVRIVKTINNRWAVIFNKTLT